MPSISSPVHPQHWRPETSSVSPTVSRAFAHTPQASPAGCWGVVLQTSALPRPERIPRMLASTNKSCLHAGKQVVVVLKGRERGGSVDRLEGEGQPEQTGRHVTPSCVCVPGNLVDASPPGPGSQRGGVSGTASLDYRLGPRVRAAARRLHHQPWTGIKPTTLGGDIWLNPFESRICD